MKTPLWLGQPSLALIAGVSVALVLLFHALGLFTPSGRWLYDHAAQVAFQTYWAKQASQRGVYEQRPVLIAIDEGSLQTLGRWPWRRSVHAQLVDTIANNMLANKFAPPSVLAWDVVFAEPHALSPTYNLAAQNPQVILNDDDADFARAINASSFPVVLAALEADGDDTTTGKVQHRHLLVPRAPLNTSTALIAHIHIQADADGSVRRYLPIERNISTTPLPYLGFALHQVASAIPIKQLLAPHTEAHTLPNLHSNPRSDSELLYPMPSNWVRRVPYQEVLSGAVPAAYFSGVPVLVAATAKGLGDQYVSHLYEPSSVVAGGELVLGALHTETLLAVGLPHLRMGHWLAEITLLFGCVGILFYGLRRCTGISGQFGVFVSVLAMVSLVCMVILAYWGIWVNAAMLGVGVTVVWMSWMSHVLHRFVVHIQSRLKRLGQIQVQNDASVKTVAPVNQSGNELTKQLASQQTSQSVLSASKKTLLNSSDALDVQLLLVQALEQRQQDDLNRFSQVLSLLPDATFVFSAVAAGEQKIPSLFKHQLHNQAAAKLCQRFVFAHAAVQANATELNAMLVDFVPDLTVDQHAYLDSSKLQSTFQWQDLLLHHQQAAFAQGVEANSITGERFLIKLAQLNVVAGNPSFDSRDVDVGATNGVRDGINDGVNVGASLIVSVIDLSVGLQLAQNRERTLNFLSHDLRAPQANIVALMELEKASHPQLEGLFSKVQTQAQRTLHLAEGFVQWSQASHRPSYQFVEYNLNELMIDALDEQWASAKRKGIHLTGYSCEQALWVLLDRSLMWRAVVNLISNALNACAADQEVRLSTRQHEHHAVIAVEDNGPGIVTALQAHLFEPFVQGVGLKRTGAGLGLAFVKTVVEQHQGLIKLHSPIYDKPQTHGTRFELWLPLAPEITEHEEHEEDNEGQ